MLLSLPFLVASLHLVVLLVLLEPCQAFVAPSPSSFRHVRPPNNKKKYDNNNDNNKNRPLMSLAAQQLLEFVEPTTGVTVKLVGAMHYNPTSIQLAQDTIRELASQDKLGSIVIESCDIRWNNTLQHEPVLQKILFSEMRAAHDLGLAYQRPVVLGDQRFNITMEQLKFGFVETIKDLVNPITGWPSIWNNITSARKEAMPFTDHQNLGLWALVDPKLLLGFPVSLVKYPFSYVAKSPIAALALFGLLFIGEDATAAAINADLPMSTTDWVGNLMGSALEIILFARIFLKELLAERNEILARNILEQCRLYQAKGSIKEETASDSLPGWVPNFLRPGHSSTGTTITATTITTNRQVVYAPDSVPPRYEGDDEKVVVAVLGMAHCNGIMRLLKEQRVS